MYRLYGTFATNQTGNTVFLTLAALHWGTSKLILAIASLGGFFGAGLIMGQLGARFGESPLHSSPCLAMSRVISHGHPEAPGVRNCLDTVIPDH